MSHLPSPLGFASGIVAPLGRVPLLGVIANPQFKLAHLSSFAVRRSTHFKKLAHPNVITT